MERTKNKKGIIVGVIALALLIAAFAVVYALTLKPTVNGEKNITVEVVHADKTVKTFEIKTDAEKLGQALKEKDLVQGTESSMGLLVTAADGEAADSNKQEWWCFTQDGVALTTGADTTPIKDGDKFEITFTVGW